MKRVRIWAAAICLGVALAPAAVGQAMPDGWRFVVSPKGDQMPCAIVREGPVRSDPKVVNARVMRNGENKIVLVAARPDWRLDPDLGPAEFDLVIDNAAPVRLSGHPLGPLLLAVIDDAELTQKVRSAGTLKWVVPWGEFQASVTGLGTAFDLTKLCPN